MKKIIVSILIILMISLASCYEIGIRNYNNEVDFVTFETEYKEAYANSNVLTFKDKDFSYYWEYELNESNAINNPSGETKFVNSYEMTKFKVKQDIDNKIFDTEYQNIYKNQNSNFEVINNVANLKYYEKDNKTFVYNKDDKSTNESIHQFNDLYMNCNSSLLALKSKDEYNDKYKFYVDNNVYTIYFYEKDIDKKYEAATLVQITFKDNKICYYKVEESKNAQDSKSITTYMEILLEEVKLKV